MHPACATRGAAPSIPIWFVTGATWSDVRLRLDARAAAFAVAAGFEPLPGRHALLPGPDGNLAAVLFGLEDQGKPINPFLPGTLAGVLPRGIYRFANPPHDPRLAALAISLGAYRFVRYGKTANEVRVEIPDGVDGAELSRTAEAVYLARDLINTPANDMGPGEIADAAASLAGRHGASTSVIVGDDLLARNFPLIHAVGRAAAREPRLIDFSWGDPAAPKVTLVGKGVCFDTGGLDIKPESAMLLMKKDMGGAEIGRASCRERV